MANYALLEWPDNLDICDTPPATYVPEIRKRFANGEWEMMCEAHALPANWEHMDFEEFLRQRRGLMAAIVRRGFDKLR